MTERGGKVEPSILASSSSPLKPSNHRAKRTAPRNLSASGKDCKFTSGQRSLYHLWFQAVNDDSPFFGIFFRKFGIGHHSSLVGLSIPDAIDFKKKTFVVPPSGGRVNRQKIRLKPVLRTKNIFLKAIA
jgi:hypothetical protein